MPTVLITGASGFIARNLAPVLRRAGLRVIGASRRASALPGFDQVYLTSLGDSLGPILSAERVDTVVHGALADGAHAYDVNVAGTTRWLEEARAAGVPLQILLSTLSATADAASDYGRAKYILEERFKAANEVVFRLGVVVGEGGMFARLRESARRSPVAPLLDGGNQLLYVLGIDFLCAALRDCIMQNGADLRGRGWNLHLPGAVTLREMVQAINRRYGYRRALVTLPARPILAGVLLLERVSGLRLPVTSANIRGLIQQGQAIIPTDFERFGYPKQSLAELMTAVP